jgi:hypothetical protein
MKKNRNVRLVLECVILAAAIARLAREVIALLGTVLNYPHECQMVHAVRA